MASHTGQGIDVRCTVLDFNPLYRVRIIRRPCLRSIVEHSRIKAGPSACAGLKEHVREFLNQPLVKTVHPKNIIMPHLPLVCPIISIGKDF